MNRRSFLQSCLALAAAPAIVRADSLMRIVPRDTAILTPALYDLSGNGNHLYWSSGGLRQLVIFDKAHDQETIDQVLQYLESTPYSTESRGMNPVAWYRVPTPPA